MDDLLEEMVACNIVSNRCVCRAWLCGGIFVVWMAEGRMTRFTDVSMHQIGICRLGGGSVGISFSLIALRKIGRFDLSQDGNHHLIPCEDDRT
jgi:hypothetical protein